MSFITSISNTLSHYFSTSSEEAATKSKTTPKEPTFDEKFPHALQTLIYSHLTADDLNKVEQANNQLERPTNIDRALKVQKELILKENPKYINVVKSWDLEKILQSEQVARLKWLVKRDSALEENPQYANVIQAWDKEKIPLFQQIDLLKEMLERNSILNEHPEYVNIQEAWDKEKRPFFLQTAKLKEFVKRDSIIQQYPEYKNIIEAWYDEKVPFPEQIAQLGALRERDSILKTNPEYKYAVEAWSKEKISYLEQAFRIRNLRDYAFGTDKWLKYFGEVVEVPLLPENIFEIVFSPCPYENGRTQVIVRQTHLLVLIPNSVYVGGNLLPLTLKNLASLINYQKAGWKYLFMHLSKHEDKPVQHSHWALMTTLLPGSHYQTYDFQTKLANHVIGYKAPNVLDAAVSILVHGVSSGNNPFRHINKTICLEKEGNRHLVVGFGYSGFEIFDMNWDRDVAVGIAALRKL